GEMTTLAGMEPFELAVTDVMGAALPQASSTSAPTIHPRVKRGTGRLRMLSPRRWRALLPLEIRILAVQRARAADGLHHVSAHCLRELVRCILGLGVGRLRQRDLHQLVRAQRVI